MPAPQRLFPHSGPALALALVLGVGLPAIEPAAAPQTVHRASAAAAGAAFLRPITAVHANGAALTWDKYVPLAGETFAHYQVHRSTSASFTPSASTLLTTINDIDVTSWVDTTAKPSTAFSYRLVADSALSNEVRVTLPAAGTSKLTLQPDATDGEATYVVHDVSTPAACSDERNYGAAGTIGIGPDSTGWQRRGLLRFDLRGIPASATVTSAKLTMSYAATTHPNLAVSLHRLRQPWTEGTGSATCNASGVTWLETQRGVRWKNAGTTFDATADASLAAKSRASAGTDVFTITALAQEWVSGSSPNHGVVIKGTTDTPGTSDLNFSYYSDDYATAGSRPLLVVTYSDGSQAVGPRVALASPTNGERVGGSVALAATAGDDRRVDRVEFLVDGVVVATDTAAPWAATWNTTGATAGAHSLTARATDDVGNMTTSTSRSVTVDNSAAPTVSLSAPANGASVAGLVTVSATASDDVSVKSVEFFVDDQRIATDTVAPYSTSWNTLDPTNTAYDGTHTITAKAYDGGGKVTTSAARTVTTRNTVGTLYAASFDLNEPGNSTSPLEIPESFLDNDLAPTSDPYSGSSSTGSLSSSPKDSTQSYATYSALTSLTTAKTGSATTSLETTQSASRDPSSISSNALWADVTVTNDSPVAWKGGADGLQLWYRWYVPTEVPKGDGSPGDQGLVLFEGPASDFFPQTLQPGSSKVVPVVVEPPRLPDGIDKAQVRLRFDLYDVDSTNPDKWFADKGNKPIDQPVVVNRDLEGALGLERYWQYEGDETGAGSSTMSNVANGNLIWRWSPMFAAGRGLATMLDITYNSLEDHSESPAGNNFSLSISGLNRWGYGLDIHPNKADEVSGRSNKYVTFTDGDGTTHEFTGTTQADGTTAWTEPPGVNLYLRSVGGTDPARQWAITKPDKTTFYFDDDGYPRSVEDRNGNVLTFTLVDTPPGENPGGPKKRVTTVTDAAGRHFDIDYYSKAEAKKAHVRGNIESIKDHSGHALRFDYYDDGNLLRLTQVGGTKANGETLADRSFVFTYTTSSGDGPAIPAAADRANPEPKTPNQSTRLYSIRDPRGTETNFAYYGPGSGQLRWKLKSRWNRLGDATAACTGANHCTSFDYNIGTRHTTVNAPENRDTEYTYDTDGKVTSIINPLEQTTTLVWSPDFKVTKVTEPGGAVRTWQYNHNGYLTEQVDALGNKTSLTFQNRSLDSHDTLGHWSLLLTKTSARGNKTSTAGDFTYRFGYTPSAATTPDGNVTSVTDPEGFATTYAWNGPGTPDAGTVKSIKEPMGGTTTFAYDPSGQPSKITGAAGNVTSLGYDADGLLRWVQDPNHSAEPDPDLAGNGRETAAFLDYDSFHRLGRQSAPKSTEQDRGKLIWSSADFDANDNVVRSVDAHYGAAGGDPENGAVSQTTWDAMDQPLLHSDQESEKTAYQWDTAGRIVSVTKPKGVNTSADPSDFSSTFDYDVLDRVVTQSDFGSSASQVRRTHMCYDVAGDLRSVTSPRAGLLEPSCPGNGPSAANYTMSYGYDAAHRETVQTDPLGHQTRTSYDADNEVVAMEKDIDKAGAPGRVMRTDVTYDQRGLTVKTEQRFDGSARVLTTVSKYDGNGNRVLMAPPRAVDQANGATLDSSSPFVTSYDYDAVNQLVKITQPFAPGEAERQYVHRAYDGNGNVLWSSLPVTSADPTSVQSSAKTTMTYWDPGWVRTSKSPTDPKLSFDYEAQSWQSSRTPDKKSSPGTPDLSRQMLWRYYSDGQLKERRDRDGNPSTYAYDLDDNLTDALDASGVSGADDHPMQTQSTWTGFDEVQKVMHRRKTDGTNNWTFSSYAYDDNGNVTRRLENGVEDSSHSTVTTGPDEHLLTYDQADWLSKQLDLGETNLDLTTGAACKDDQRIMSSYFDSSWEKKRDVYRAGGSCTSDPATWPLKTTTTWDYFDNGKLKVLKTVDGSGAVETTHNVGYTETATATGGVTVQRYENGNRTTDRYVLKRADSQTTCTDVANPCTATYTYDGRGRLTRHQRRAGVVDTYTLDDPADLIGDKTIRAGNITTKDTAEDPAVTQRYDSNQLKEATVGTATASYVYDPYGNVDCVTNVAGSSTCPTTGLVKDYAYDSLNRLATQKTYSGGSTVTDSADYTYDALDRVTKEVEDHGGTGDDRTTSFTHQGLSNLVTEEKQSGGTNPKTKTFSYDAYGHRISMSDTVNGSTTTNTFTYSYDVHGSVAQLISDSGSVKASYGYDAYGDEDEGLSTTQDATTDTDKNPLNPYRFQGRRLDSGSATASSAATSMDLGSRRFGVDTARFLQEDMFGGALADLGLTLDPLAQNRYSLAGSNPVSFVEVDGHMYIADGGGGASTSPNPTSSTTSSSGSTSSSASDSGPPEPTYTPPWRVRPISDYGFTVNSLVKDYYSGEASELRRATHVEAGRLAQMARASRLSTSPYVSASRASRYTNTMMSTLEAGARQAGKYEAIVKGAKGLGYVGTAVGAVSSFAGQYAADSEYSQGERITRAATRSLVTTGVSVGFGVAAGAACGLVTGGIAAAACGFVGSEIGAFVGDKLADAVVPYADDAYRAVSSGIDAVGEGLSDVGEGISDGADAVGDFLGF